ncbi:hypothetical protein AB0F52_45415 [Amycolatopsis sp. NPDC024027]
MLRGDRAASHHAHASSTVAALPTDSQAPCRLSDKQAWAIGRAGRITR